MAWVGGTGFAGGNQGVSSETSREVFTLSGSPGDLLAAGRWRCQSFFHALVVATDIGCIQQGL